MKSATPVPHLQFTVSGARRGARSTLPVALSVSVYAVVFGVLARQAGLNISETLLMSAIVFAGASQFVALGLWAAPLPGAAIVLTTLVVNLRHVLMGASLSPWLLRVPRSRALASVFFMTDETWALTAADLRAGGDDPAFLLGAGLTLWSGWVLGSAIGRTAGGIIHDPVQFGLDFAFAAVFIALLAGLWRGRRDVLPWCVAGAVAVAASRLLPGNWYILLGGLAGSAVGAVIRER